MTSLLEDTIQKVEVLYQSLTGNNPPPPNGAYAPVPPEADPLAHVEAQLARLSSLVANPEPLATPTWSPSVTIWEDDKDLVVEMDLAGINASEVDVVTIKQLVTISGKRKELSGAKRIWTNEQRIGPFCRSILLPAPVETKSMRRTSDRGLLQLRFARRGAAIGEVQSSDPS